MSFYNTNQSTEKEVLKESRRCRQQESIILNFFQLSTGKWTPFDILERCFEDGTPITSIRRAMTNLTQKGFLQKTNTVRIGKYGKKNHIWELNYNPKNGGNK